MAESKAPGVLCFDVEAKAEDRPDFEIVTFENQALPGGGHHAHI